MAFKRKHYANVPFKRIKSIENDVKEGKKSAKTGELGNNHIMTQNDDISSRMTLLENRVQDAVSVGGILLAAIAIAEAHSCYMTYDNKARTEQIHKRTINSHFEHQRMTSLISTQQLVHSDYIRQDICNLFGYSYGSGGNFRCESDMLPRGSNKPLGMIYTETKQRPEPQRKSRRATKYMNRPAGRKSPALRHMKTGY